MSKPSITLSPDVLYQDVAGEAVLLDLASDRYFGLNPVGARAWQLLRDGVDGEGLVDALQGEYDISREALESDIGELLDRLADSGLIRFG